ncbi:MAG: hypothetical protein SFX73_22295 [Kofleriaceae bacterium]|nr:hypothetical protein [Kofleriaceae bacterium]
MLRAGIVAMVLSGCSFALVSGPPANHQQMYSFDCTTSRLGPGLDTVWSVLQVLNLASAASRSDSEWDETFDGKAPFSRATAVPLYGSLAALGIAGMYYGFTRTAKCRSAKDELNTRMMGERFGAPMQPGVGTWPPPGPTATPPAPTPPPAPPTAPPDAPITP